MVSNMVLHYNESGINSTSQGDLELTDVVEGEVYQEQTMDSIGSNELNNTSPIKNINHTNQLTIISPKPNSNVYNMEPEQKEDLTKTLVIAGTNIDYQKKLSSGIYSN